ncbi:hypothetical protein V2J09_009375, partial [Rumex salicifolius]
PAQPFSSLALSLRSPAGPPFSSPTTTTATTTNDQLLHLSAGISSLPHISYSTLTHLSRSRGLLTWEVVPPDLRLRHHLQHNENWCMGNVEL